MMRSATDFLPRVISTLTNFASSTLLNFGSGRISRLGTSLRRGMNRLFALCRFGRLGAVLRTGLLAVLHALRVERAAHDVVAHAGQVLARDHRGLRNRPMPNQRRLDLPRLDTEA